MNTIRKMSVRLVIFFCLITIFIILIIFSPYKIFRLNIYIIIIGIIAGVVILALNLIITKFSRRIAGQIPPNYNPFEKMNISNKYFITFLILFFVIVEELIFRSYILYYFSLLISKNVSIILTSIAFAILHYKGRYLQIFIMSVILCFITLRTNNLLTPITAHFVNNYFIYLNNSYGKNNAY